jgi:uncharacterized membrane-anchored protein YhcB (DUF1043 family)
VPKQKNMPEPTSKKPPVERILLFILLGLILASLVGYAINRWWEEKQAERDAQMEQTITKNILSKVRKELSDTPTDMAQAKSLLEGISKSTNNLLQRLNNLEQRVGNLETATLEMQQANTSDVSKLKAEIAKLRADTSTALNTLNTKLLRLAEQTQLPKAPPPVTHPPSDFPPAY